MHLFGGSWGSTLALAYAIQFPECCASLVLRGIFLGQREALLFLYQGNASTYTQAPDAYPEPGAYICYPEAWREFLSVLDPGERDNVIQSYKAIFDGVDDHDEQRRLEAALAWSTWEGTICNLTPEPHDLGKYADPRFALSCAAIEAHYFVNDIFLEPHYIVRNIGRITQIPVHIVHGRFDLVCPLPQAMQLKAALEAARGNVRTFVVTSAGHSAFERETALALTSIMDGLPKQV
jgi:proline iminopeptidase